MSEFPQTRMTLLMRVAQEVKDSPVDKPGQAELYYIYKSSVVAFCKKMMSGDRDDEDTVENIVAETFHQVFKSIHRFEAPEGKAGFRYWLKTIARRQVANHYRRLKQENKYLRFTANIGNAPSESDDWAEPSDSDDSNEPLNANDWIDPSDTNESMMTPEEDKNLMNEELLKGMKVIESKFAKKTWLAFYRKVFEMKSYAEIAEELGLPENTVRQYKSRVWKAVTEYFKDVFDIPEQK